MKILACEDILSLEGGNRDGREVRILCTGTSASTGRQQEIVLVVFLSTPIKGSSLLKDSISEKLPLPLVYAFDAVCPHAGGPLDIGDIEELCADSTHAVVCPWHEYRFPLVSSLPFSSGSITRPSSPCGHMDVKSIPRSELRQYLTSEESTNLQLQCYPTHLKPFGDMSFSIYIDLGEGINWIDTQMRLLPSSSNCVDQVKDIEEKLNNTSIASLQDPSLDNNLPKSPSSLVEWAFLILRTPNPQEKVTLTHQAAELWRSGELPLHLDSSSSFPPDVPSRESHIQFLEPWKIRSFGKGGSVAARTRILHSLANVEQWAIDLAWDAIARFHAFCPSSGDFGTEGEPLPRAFFDDFVRMACEEAKHYTFLENRLVDFSSHFGAYPCHAGLWDSAAETSHSLLARLAVVHMIHEARGLDVNPSTIAKFHAANDTDSVEILSIIHNEEIGHVAIGQRWFSWICERQGNEQVRFRTFHELAKKHFRGYLKPPFNKEDRARAGLDARYYLPLAHDNVGDELESNSER